MKHLISYLIAFKIFLRFQIWDFCGIKKCKAYVSGIKIKKTKSKYKVGRIVFFDSPKYRDILYFCF